MSNKIGAADLEEVFHEQLKTFFFSQTEITKYLSQADRVIKEKEELLQTLIDEEQKIKQDMDRVYSLFIDKLIAASGFGERYKPLEERQKQIEDQIPEVQAEIDFLKIQYLSSDEIFQEAKDLYSRWPELTTDEKRKIVESITDQIIVEDDEVTINLCYLPSSTEMTTDRVHNPTHPAFAFEETEPLPSQM